MIKNGQILKRYLKIRNHHIKIVILVVILTFACGYPSTKQKSLIQKNQNALQTLEYRINTIEHNVQSLKGTIQSQQDNVYVIYNSKGKKTGITAYYAEHNFIDVLFVSKQVTATFSKYHKTADALLKVGLIYNKLGDSTNSQLQHRAILAGFPNSNAFEIGHNRNI